MSTPRDRIDETLRRSFAPAAMSEAESAALWELIEAGAARDEGAPAPARGRGGRLGSRRFRLAGAAAAVAAVAIAAVSLAPSGGDRRPGALDLARLSSASAAEVFGLTAEAAREQPALVPGPGQVLYFHLTHTTDDGSRSERAEIEEWIGPDGRGVRLDGLSGASSSSSDGGTRFEPLRIEFDAAAGTDRGLTVTDSWRAILTLDELEAVPTEPRAALRYVRRHVAASAGTTQRSRAGEHRILGDGFLVLASISSMLMEAPLTGEQRAALLEVVADAPRWYRSDGTAAIEVVNEGRSSAADGTEGILIQAAMRLSPVEAAMLGSERREIGYGVLLDPDGGAVLETRVGFGAGRPPAIRITSRALELRDAADLPAP